MLNLSPVLLSEQVAHGWLSKPKRRRGSWIYLQEVFKGPWVSASYWTWWYPLCGQREKTKRQEDSEATLQGRQVSWDMLQDNRIPIKFHTFLLSKGTLVWRAKCNFIALLFLMFILDGPIHTKHHKAYSINQAGNPRVSILHSYLNQINKYIILRERIVFVYLMLNSFLLSWDGTKMRCLSLISFLFPSPNPPHLSPARVIPAGLTCDLDQ